MACLRLFTFLPLLPLLRVPRLRLRIARSTSFEAPREYRRAMIQLLLIRAGLAPALRLGSQRADGNNSQASLFVPVRVRATLLRWAPLVSCDDDI
jgi:hypothetical protein